MSDDGHDYLGGWIDSYYESDYTTGAVLACPRCGTTPAIKPYGDYEPKVYVACPDCDAEGWVHQYEVNQ